MIPELRYAAACPSPLGYRIDIEWSITVETVPAAYRTILFRKRGAAVTDSEVTNWRTGAGHPHVGISVYVIDTATENTTPPDATTFYIPDSEQRTAYDMNCANGSTYHYALYVQDTAIPSDMSVIKHVYATAACTAVVKMFNVKEYLLFFLKQLLVSIGTCTLDKDVFVTEQFTNLIEHDPQVAVFRQAETEAQRYIGGIQETDNIADVRSSMRTEVYGVIWQSKTAGQIDSLYAIFHACEEALIDAFMRAGATSCKCQFGAEEVVSDADGVWGRRGRMTVIVQHDQTRISIDRADRTSIETEITPAEPDGVCNEQD